jgi:hypothetical protein
MTGPLAKLPIGSWLMNGFLQQFLGKETANCEIPRFGTVFRRKKRGGDKYLGY